MSVYWFNIVLCALGTCEEFLSQTTPISFSWRFLLTFNTSNAQNAMLNCIATDLCDNNNWVVLENYLDALNKSVHLNPLKLSRLSRIWQQTAPGSGIYFPFKDVQISLNI